MVVYFKYDSVYPYFMGLTNVLISNIRRRLEFGKLQPDEVKFLHDILNGLNALNSAYLKKPAISNINIEWAVRELAKQDREMDGVLVSIIFHGKAAQKLGQIEFFLNP